MPIPKEYELFNQEEWTRKYNGKLSASSQPGYLSSGRSKQQDKVLLKKIQEDGMTPVEAGVDQKLLNELEGLYNEGVRTIYSLAHEDNDRNPALLKHLWENIFKDRDDQTPCTYITNIGDIETKIPDFSAPTQEQLKAITSDALVRIENGEHVLVHCGAGIGRTSAVLTALQIVAHNIYDISAAEKAMKGNYPGGRIETDGQKNILKEFIDYQKENFIKSVLANDQATIEEKNSAYVIAANGNMQEIAKQILERRCDLEASLTQCNMRGKVNALNFALNEGREGDVVICINSGANVKLQDDEGNSLFSKIIATENPQLIDAMYKAPAFDINQIDKDGKSPLSYAIGVENEQMVEYLIMKGAEFKNISTDNISDEKLQEYWRKALESGSIQALINLADFAPELKEHKISDKSFVEFAKGQENKDLYIEMVAYGLTNEQSDKEAVKQLLAEKPTKIKDLILSDVKSLNLSFLKDYNHPYHALPMFEQYLNEEACTRYLTEAIDENHISAIQKLSKLHPPLVRNDKVLANTLDKQNNDIAIELALSGFQCFGYQKTPALYNALSVAIALDDLDHAKSLLNKPDIDITKITAEYLIKAIEHKNLDMIKILFDKGADFNQVDKDGKTPLMHAMEAGSSIVEFISNIPDIKLDAVSKEGKTALMYAVEATAFDAIPILAGKIGVIDQVVDGKSALTEAIRLSKPGMLSKLIENGANVNLADTQGETPLMKAISKNLPVLVDKLIDAGAEINAVDYQGNTVFTYAIKASNREAISTILQKVGDVDEFKRSDDFRESLKSANAPKVLSTLIDLRCIGVEEHLDQDNSTALIKMVSFKSHTDTEGVKEFIKKYNPNIRAKDSQGRTPLMNIIINSEYNGNIRLKKLLPLLIESIEDQDNDGKTALSHATNKTPITALSHATNKTPIIEMLLSAGAIANDSHLMGINIPQVLLKLVENGANINAPINDQNQTIIMKCNSLEQSIKALNAGASLEFEDNNGKKAIDYLVEVMSKNQTSDKFNELLETLVKKQTLYNIKAITDQLKEKGIDISADIRKRQVKAMIGRHGSLEACFSADCVMSPDSTKQHALDSRTHRF